MSEANLDQRAFFRRLERQSTAQEKKSFITDSLISTNRIIGRHEKDYRPHFTYPLFNYGSSNTSCFKHRDQTNRYQFERYLTLLRLSFSDSIEQLEVNLKFRTLYVSHVTCSCFRLRIQRADHKDFSRFLCRKLKQNETPKKKLFPRAN